MKFKIDLIALSLVAGAFVPLQSASAATASSTMGVSANVTANCTVSTSAVAFGSYNAINNTAVDATGGITVTCTNGTAWAASADAGLGSGATLAVRKMKDADSNLLDYALYTDESRSAVWGNGASGTATLSDVGTGAAQSKTIYGRIAAGQVGAKAGAYSDTINVTVTY